MQLLDSVYTREKEIGNDTGTISLRLHRNGSGKNQNGSAFLAYEERYDLVPYRSMCTRVNKKPTVTFWGTDPLGFVPV